MALTALAIGAALGLGKSELVDKPAAERARKLAAATQRYNPWTGAQAEKVQEADPVGSTLQGATSGIGLQQNYAKNQAQTNWLNGNTNGGNSPIATATTANGINSGAGTMTPNAFWSQQNPYSIK